jgi:hypothetical protein
VALLDDLRASADLPVVKPWHDKTEYRGQMTEGRCQRKKGRREKREV